MFGLNVLLETLGHFSDDEVTLQPNTIERHILRFESLDEVLHSCRLRTWSFNVVVIDVKLGVRVRGASSIKSD